MSKNTTTQYQQNIDIIKSFFRRPIVLIVGIFTIVASIVNSVMTYMAEYNFREVLESHFGHDCYHTFDINGTVVAIWDTNSTSEGFSLDLLAIAIGISLVLLFAFGISKGNAIQGGVTFFKVMAHIYYVAAFILAVCAVLMVIVSFAFTVDNLIKLILIISFLVLGFVIFLFGYSQLQFAKSIKKSINSIYLSNSGAKLHGIMRIISTVIIGIVSAIVIWVIIYWGGFNTTSVAVTTIIPVVLLMISNVLWAVFALKYHSYINGINSGKIEMPVVTVNEEKEMICNNCGSSITDEDVFCAVCGNKVQNN